MKTRSTIGVLVLLVAAMFLLASASPSLVKSGLTAEAAGAITAGKADPGKDVEVAYTAMQPMIHGNLRIFPVAATMVFDTRKFITLEEGLRSGDVVVSEAGQALPLVRPRGRRTPPPTSQGGADVNRLVLVNNSSRPLLLLAGEIVTGGKQDRVVGKDRIIPPHSEPVDLSVFCVEPGRWSASYGAFDAHGYAMAQPNVRKEAMANKDQQRVWAGVAQSNQEVAAAAEVTTEVSGSGGSYARVMNDREVRKHLDEKVAPIQRSYEGLLKELRAQKAVGVVVAVNGEIVWADLFASTALLEKYWPKLVRSYAAEAVSQRAKSRKAPDAGDAQAFLEHLDGKRQIVESEPQIFRHTETSGEGYRVFELTSLLPGTGYTVHVSKMAM